MKKYLLLLTLLPIYSQAESNRSMFMTDIPKQCMAEDISNEIMIIQNGYDIAQVIDVTNVEAVQASENKLVCLASLVTEKYTKKYQISFVKNSIGQIIVTY